MKTHIDLRLDGDIGHIVLKPDPITKPPAFDQDSLAELDMAISRIQEKAKTIRFVILSSDSERHFLVGANIHALAELTAETIGDWVREGHRVFNRLENLPFPVIAIVNGSTLGGGLELALACDFILAGPNARFGLPELRLGLTTGWGGAWRLMQRVGRGKARELLYAGRFVDSIDAHQIGLCDFYGSNEELKAWLEQFVADTRGMSSASIAETKAMLLELGAHERNQACELEISASERLMASPDTEERLNSFFERRKI